MKKILAVASGGGHWVQLLRLLPAFDGCDVAIASTSKADRSRAQSNRFYAVSDALPSNAFALLAMYLRIGWILWKERPEVVVSTGAVPGYIALRLARFVKARTIWIDSIANVDELSLDGQKIGKHADLWLTQWPHLARPEGPHFVGAVL